MKLTPNTYSTKIRVSSSSYIITLPIKLVEMLSFKHGDYLECRLNENDEIVMSKLDHKPLAAKRKPSQRQYEDFLFMISVKSMNGNVDLNEEYKQYFGFPPLQDLNKRIEPELDEDSFAVKNATRLRNERIIRENAQKELADIEKQISYGAPEDIYETRIAELKELIGNS